MQNLMKFLFVALLVLVLAGLWLAYPAGFTSVRFLVVVALGVLGVIAWLVFQKVRAILFYINGRAIGQGQQTRGLAHFVSSSFARGAGGGGDPDTNKPTEPPPSGF